MPRTSSALAAVLLALPPAAPASGRGQGPSAEARAQLAAQVRSEFLHAWEGYRRYAWGHDELNPLSRSPHDWYREPLLMTPVDALDTMLVMGLEAEAKQARELIAGSLRFDRDLSVKGFEITIRLLGGLLSAYQMTADDRLLALAADLGRRLAPSFDSPTGLPYMYVNLKTGKTSGARTNPAEIGTLVLELGTLARLTKTPALYDKPKRALLELHRRRSALGLVGDELDVESGEWTGRTSHLGGGIDSYYEYLLKCQRLFDDADCGRMWRESRPALDRHLADEGRQGLWYGEADMRTGHRLATRYGALQAFFPAVLAMDGDLGRARRLQDSGFRMWGLHGVEPESIDYAAMRVEGPGYELRPEIMESAYYLHHYTGDPRYLEMGRTFLADLVRNCRTEAGYAVLRSVVTKQQGDRMPSYFLAETLKYLYLLFEPAALDFDAVVFNTEAHPLRKVP